MVVQVASAQCGRAQHVIRRAASPRMCTGNHRSILQGVLRVCAARRDDLMRLLAATAPDKQCPGDHALGISLADLWLRQHLKQRMVQIAPPERQYQSRAAASPCECRSLLRDIGENWGETLSIHAWCLDAPSELAAYVPTAQQQCC